MGVVFDWQADEVRLHVDGCLDTIADLSACDGFTSTDKFFLGASSDLSVPFNLKGQLDEVQLYTRALTSAEVESVFEEAGTPSSCAGAAPAVGAPLRILLVGALAFLGALVLYFPIGHARRGPKRDEEGGP